MADDLTLAGVPESYGALQSALMQTEDLEQFLHELAMVAARLIPGTLVCGITVQRDGSPSTAACSDPLAADVDDIQYRLGDGPCLRAIQEGTVTIMDDTAGHSRWPKFAAEAESRGIRSCLAVPLTTDGAPIGALNIYARQPSAFGPAQVRRAENLAGYASGALALAVRLASYSALTGQLRASLASRAIIDQALGVIMAQERCTQAQAMVILRTASQNRNVKLRDVASAVVASVSGEPPQPPSPFEDGLP